MKRILTIALLLCGWLAPGASAAIDESPSARIVADAVHTGRPPRIVAFRAQTAGLEPPLRYHWNLGNGREWDKPFVPEQAYEPGRYDVVLTVRDAGGHVVKASLVVDTESHGCGF
jgi:hypothetical protein